ncbi:N-acetylmuramoyl-L-alanine amidase [Streptomyces sp. NPDC058953]|uniref:N-acetylmuramoyl-L-alanine amidase n=1 Tax=unclassified Streptomyces TaxID=2593676 RepID=UPI0036C01F6A
MGAGKRRLWWGGGAVAAGVAGVLVIQGVAGGPGGSGGGKNGAKAEPPRTEARATGLRVADDGTSAALPRQDTEPFSMLGVTWTDPAARITGTVEVRTKSAASGKWTGWRRLAGDHALLGDAGGRGGTDPVWVGPSRGVEVRATAGGAVTKLPGGLRLDMVDPGTGSVTAMEPAAYARPLTDTEAGTDDTAGTETAPAAGNPAGTTAGDTAGTGTPATDPAASTAPAETPAPTPSTEPPVPQPTGPTPGTTPSTTPSATTPTVAPTPTPGPPSTAPRPPITDRAGWQADESMSPEAPAYLPEDRVKAVTVHHTSETNDYTCAQSPAIVRGLYAYHVKGRGWKDIGYHFLVDKCGNVFEGRKGGMDRPVVGAHAYGFNSETTSVSILGNFMQTPAPQPALNAAAGVAAWKLGQYGVDPAGNSVLTAAAAGGNLAGRKWTQGARLTFPTIHGHGDVYATECPGKHVFPQLKTIRELAGGAVSGLSLTSVTGGGTVGATTYVKNAATVNWKATTPAALIGRYEVLVNGKVAASTPGTATSARVTLAAGTHRVEVRATHISRKTVTSAARTVVADTTAPVFSTRPSVALRPGTASATAVPVTLAWKAGDARALKDVRLTKPTAAVHGPTVTSAPLTAKPGTATTWSLTAYDQAGNSTAASVAATPVILQESQAVRTGSWSTKSSSGYLGKKSYSSSTKNASLTWSFTGRSAGWVVSRAATSGQASIYVDGKLVKTVDLRSTATKFRDVIWSQTWASSAKHTVKIVVTGTAKRPTVTTDGLFYLR